MLVNIFTVRILILPFNQQHEIQQNSIKGEKYTESNCLAKG